MEALEEELAQLLKSYGKAEKGPGHRPMRRLAVRGSNRIADRMRTSRATTARTPVKRGRRKMSAKAKARLSAFAKARWKKAKAAGKSAL